VVGARRRGTAAGARWAVVLGCGLGWALAPVFPVPVLPWMAWCLSWH
jgi:hypothetical protein